MGKIVSITVVGLCLAFGTPSAANMRDDETGEALYQRADDTAEALKKRGYELDLEAFRALDARRKDADVRSQDLQAQRKKASKEVGELIKSGMDVEFCRSLE